MILHGSTIKIGPVDISKKANFSRELSTAVTINADTLISAGSRPLTKKANKTLKSWSVDGAFLIKPLQFEAFYLWLIGENSMPNIVISCNNGENELLISGNVILKEVSFTASVNNLVKMSYKAQGNGKATISTQ